ncbi:hypothetical protein HYE82_23940 [Streptomyces sp. BR123]|uniref:hypothetical protein n=1 Tax=Streptomyces sp. BR123 TaxID=2749828 RepID=UPI0015C4CF08|nr:hypothetical protein [Streptomyces sp. BR123]NXY97369.1 hypothetical protein [Streptomyces sp. BR123]
MGFESRVWRLVRLQPHQPPGEQQGERDREPELLGEIEIVETDFPWLRGRFTAQRAFAEFRPWFDEALAALEDEDFERFDEVYESMTRTLRLVSPDGPVAEFLLHIQGDAAWFRWSDTPFES